MTDSEGKFPKKLFAWALGLALLFGVVGAGEYPEDRLRTLRNYVNEHPVSGDIVLITLDEKSMQEEGRWPWPRARYGQLIDRIGAANPRMQLHDMIFVDRTDAANDTAMANALRRNRNVILPALGRRSANGTTSGGSLLMPQFNAAAQLGSIEVKYNYANEIWRNSYGTVIEGRYIPSFASLITGQKGPVGADFRIDYSLDLKSVPKFSASDLLQGKVPLSKLAGKTVIVGPDAWRQYDEYMFPGKGKFGGVYVHILSAETLMAGKQIDLSWYPSLIFAMACVIACFMFQRLNRPAVLVGATAILLFGPILAERHLVFIDVTPGLFLLAVVGGALGWAHFKSRGLVNTLTGLPNLNAFKRAKAENDRPIIVARVINYAQIVSTLPSASEREFVEQITKRLRVGSQVTAIYQGDDGIFAWTIEQGTSIGHHVEALHALFRSPAKVNGQPYDIAITFGVEIGSGRSIANRFGSALVAADEAAADGLKWKYHDPERLRDAGWRLSLLSQLDDAIDNGEVWVAYQPQLDLQSNTIRGCEALARWTHPEKGPISPAEFITAAEHHDRIEKLTMFVLDKAVAAASQINRKYGRFDMAVNLSARMLQDRRLPAKVREILNRHSLDPSCLTLELTETAAMSESGSDIESLLRLRDLGVRISIDDYGTGLSTLDYLKKVPASEIKIDQSFIKSMRDNRSDMVMVQSTIALAHSLDRTVVAEGVENREALDLLISMNCEVAQGFIIGRPTSLDGLIKRLHTKRSASVA